MNRDRLIRLFCELVAIDSETGDEGNMYRALKKKLVALGLDVVSDQAQKDAGCGANNLVATLCGSTGGTPIVLCVHMDTVLHGKNIHPRIAGGYIVSAGPTILGSDDKAGIAAILEAIQVIRERYLDHGPVQFLFTVGEESGLAGSRALDLSLLHADYGFVLDSDGPVGNLSVATPYRAQLEARLYGRSARADVVKAGKSGSAVRIAAQAVDAMPLGRIDSDTTADIGHFEGGNTADGAGNYVKIIAEARSLVKEKIVRQTAEMAAVFKNTAVHMGGKADVHTRLIYPGYRYDGSDSIVRLAAGAVTAVGRAVHLLQNDAGSDANVLSCRGLPAINLSIGYEAIHTVHERIAIEELVKTSELVLALINQAIAKEKPVYQ